ncbi:PIN domain-containing protein [Priestia filamentosa]|uniref:PIN-like domain-containing protein n=1 Tax=Priestia filamentosa TaxID=1402861 RepID=UPI003981E55D
MIDANALLNTYKMHQQAREQFFNVLRYGALNPKLWMPYQVGWELFKNRKNAIDESLDAVKNAKSDIQKAIKNLKSKVEKSGLKFHGEFLNQIQQELDSFNQKMETDFSEYSKENQNKRSNFYSQKTLKETDSIIDEIDDIFKDKFADPHTHQELMDLYYEGERRFALKIPPGFKDDSKENYSKFGDFIIWEEMIQKSSATQKPIIFVTEDQKEDWWLIDPTTNEKSILPELLREFKSRTGQFFYMYSYKNFINQAKKRYKDLPEADQATEQMSLAADDLSTSFPYGLKIHEEREKINRLTNKLYELNPNLRDIFITKVVEVEGAPLSDVEKAYHLYTIHSEFESKLNFENTLRISDMNLNTTYYGINN